MFFDAVRNNRRIVQAFLALITLPFALWGVESYLRNNDSGSTDEVAQVGATKIFEAELTDAIHTQQQTLRQQMGAAYNQADADRPEFRASVLDSLVNQKAIAEAVQKDRLQVPDALVQERIKADEGFQDNGKFSLQKYDEALTSHGLTRAAYDDIVRNDVAQQLLLAPVLESAVVPNASLNRWLVLQDEERTVSEWPINGKAFQSQVKLAPDAAKKYYDGNRGNFEIPPRIKVEYVTLSSDQIAAQTKVSDADAKKWYDDHISQYQAPEERRASHILIAVDSKASKEAHDAARKKAEDVLAKLKAKPSDFARLAKEVSQDDLSAAKGGDLGFFGRNAMVKPFEDAVFALKPNQMSGIVETEFGYHIILLTDIRGGTTKPFSEVRDDIVDQLSKDAASKRFSEVADQFGNMVYEQADALKPVADKLGLTVQQSDWLERNKPGAGVLGNEKFLSALFSDDSIKNRRNTEAIDLGKGLLVSGRVVDYKPTQQKPFEEVKAQIEQQLTAEEGNKLARADGEAKLAKLQAGQTPAGTAWGVAKTLKRSSPELTADVRKAVFAPQATKTPAYAGVEMPNGYSIFRVDKVSIPTINPGDNRLASLRQSYERALGDQDVRSFVAGVRQRTEVKVFLTPDRPSL
ncbi:MAG TPA: SurA N-terminal domain-containing protein [Rhodocyclaceae bacterium]|nr:SurA N-terminal domain-containing protein [Rhodocyclaceae bacterium]